MLKKDQKKIVDAIIKAQLNPNIFVRDNSERYFELTHSNSALTFIFFPDEDNSLGIFGCRYNLIGRIDFYTNHQTIGSVDEVIERQFLPWLESQVKVFIDDAKEPDPWEAFNAESAFEQIDNADESNFSVTEKQQLASAVNNFERLLQEKFQISDTQQQEILKELKYLRSSLDNLNKRDWKAVATQILRDIGLNIIANVSADRLNEYHLTIIEVFKVILSLPHSSI